MTRTDTTRAEVLRLVKATPFQPFALNMENGDRVIIEHPENIAFDSTENGRPDISVIANRLRYYSTFDAVTSVALLDRGELPSS
jgi:hypothetical protein